MPAPPADEPQLDWLVQDSPGSYDSTINIPEEPHPPPSAYDDDAGYQEDIIDENTYAATASFDSDKSISQQYQERGLDMLSGDQPGFGAVQGIEKAGGDLSNRGSVEDVKVPGGGKVGDVGVTMGGDFGSHGNSNVGGARSSARYSGGGGGGFGGIGYGD